MHHLSFWIIFPLFLLPLSFLSPAISDGQPYQRRLHPSSFLTSVASPPLPPPLPASPPLLSPAPAMAHEPAHRHPPSTSSPLHLCSSPPSLCSPSSSCPMWEVAGHRARASAASHSAMGCRGRWSSTSCKSRSSAYTNCRG